MLAPAGLDKLEKTKAFGKVPMPLSASDGVAEGVDGRRGGIATPGRIEDVAIAPPMPQPSGRQKSPGPEAQAYLDESALASNAAQAEASQPTSPPPHGLSRPPRRRPIPSHLTSHQSGAGRGIPAHLTAIPLAFPTSPPPPHPISPHLTSFLDSTPLPYSGPPY